MSEPPIEVSAEGVEPKPRKTGHRASDLAIGLAALLISLTSLAVAIHHGKTQERLVAAIAWPYLTCITTNGGFGEEPGRIVLAIEGAKAPETRAGRIASSVERLRDGRT